MIMDRGEASWCIEYGHRVGGQYQPLSVLHPLWTSHIEGGHAVLLSIMLNAEFFKNLFLYINIYRRISFKAHGYRSRIDNEFGHLLAKVCYA